ncbi:MAG: hypothetical protein U0694_14325 [Anaerolineae bacterium]
MDKVADARLLAGAGWEAQVGTEQQLKIAARTYRHRDDQCSVGGAGIRVYHISLEQPSLEEHFPTPATDAKTKGD